MNTEYAWKTTPTGSFVVSSDGSTTFTSPSSIQVNYPYVLRVKDDDGNFSYDTANLTVGKDWEWVGGASPGNATSSGSSTIL